MRRFGFLVLAGAGVAAGCNLLLTDYETAGAGAAGAGGSHAGGNDSGGNDTGGNNLGTPAKGLERDEAVGADALEVFRDGFFRIATDAEHHWQWSHWYYLPTDPDHEAKLGPEEHDASNEPNYYYRTRCLWTATRSEDDAHSYQFRSCRHSTQTQDNAEPASATTPVIGDEALPVYLTLDSTVESNTGSSVTFTTRVYASGLVWTASRADLVYFDPVVDVDVNYGFISLSDGEFVRGDDHVFRQVGGAGALLQVDMSGLGELWTTTYLTDPAALYNLELPELPDETQIFVAGFVLGDDERLTEEAIDRETDLRNPSLEVAGGRPAGVGGRDPDTGTYLVDSGTTPSLTLDLGTTQTRFEPAFEIRDWPAATFAIRLNGQLLATSSANGPMALAKLTKELGETPATFVFQYLGTIPAGASDAERQFVITAD